MCYNYPINLGHRGFYMKIIETTGFLIKFSVDNKNNDFSVIDFVHKINYGGGSMYQKFKKNVSESLSQDLKNIKDFDFFATDTLSDNFNFTLISSDFEQAKKLSKILANLVKELSLSNQKVQVSIERKFIAEELCIEFGV